jgi:hypothetical protein
MFDHGSRTACTLLLLCVATATPANAAGPRASFTLNAEGTVTAPDQTLRVEQYSKALKDQGVLYQFWTFDRDRRHAFLLNPGEGHDLAGYAAGFRFSPDSQWLVRMQKLGAGYQTLFLYHRKGDQFSPVTTRPLGDLAWDYFFTTPASQGMHRAPKNPYALGHAFAGLIKGMEENYAWMGQHWPDSRYIVISLSFDTQGEEKPSPWIEGWRCVYDLKTLAFSVPPDFAEHNAKAVRDPRPKSE